MAVLRDAFRLALFEPFARWKLGRDLDHRRRKRKLLNGTANTNGKANGNGAVANGTGKAKENGVSNGNGHSHTNGNGHSYPSPAKEERQMHRSVLRFAEQGWSVVYYTLQWSYGLVRPS